LARRDGRALLVVLEVVRSEEMDNMEAGANDADEER